MQCLIHLYIPPSVVPREAHAPPPPLLHIERIVDFSRPVISLVEIYCGPFQTCDLPCINILWIFPDLSSPLYKYIVKLLLLFIVIPLARHW